jgi:hypothetical protein
MPVYRRQGMSDNQELSGEKMYKLPGGEIVPVISLRDYFAAAAVTGFIASQDYPEERIKWLARQAYLIADAMLGSREE